MKEIDPFANLIGQNQAVTLLRRAVSQNRVAPAYLFVGPPGVGRSLAARCFVESILCANLADPKARASVRSRLQARNHPDVLWVEPTYQHQGKLFSAKEAVEAGLKRKAAPQIRLEQIREISRFLSRPPLEAPRSMVVLDEAETMAEAAANGLLKTLEEPGLATLIAIAPTEESLLPTLVSRTQRIPFYRLDREAIEQILRQTGHGEILANRAVMELAGGSAGEAIAAWEQLQAIPADLLQKLTQLLPDGKKAAPISPRQCLELARQIDSTLDTEMQLWLVDYLQQYYWQPTAAVVRASCPHLFPLHLLEKARQHLLSYAQPRLVWEVTLIDMISHPALKK